MHEPPHVQDYVHQNAYMHPYLMLAAVSPRDFLAVFLTEHLPSLLKNAEKKVTIRGVG